MEQLDNTAQQEFSLSRFASRNHEYEVRNAHMGLIRAIGGLVETHVAVGEYATLPNDSEMMMVARTHMQDDAWHVFTLKRERNNMTSYGIHMLTQQGVYPNFVFGRGALPEDSSDPLRRLMEPQVTVIGNPAIRQYQLYTAIASQRLECSKLASEVAADQLQKANFRGLYQRALSGFRQDTNALVS